MSKEMRQHIDNFRNFLTENSKKKLNISDVRSSDDTITLTKDELETFLKDWDKGHDFRNGLPWQGSWSDKSKKIVRFLGMEHPSL